MWPVWKRWDITRMVWMTSELIDRRFSFAWQLTPILPTWKFTSRSMLAGPNRSSARRVVKPSGQRIASNFTKLCTILQKSDSYVPIAGTNHSQIAPNWNDIRLFTAKRTSWKRHRLSPLIQLKMDLTPENHRPAPQPLVPRHNARWCHKKNEYKQSMTQYCFHLSVFCHD